MMWKIFAVACIGQALATFKFIEDMKSTLKTVVEKGIDLKTEFNEWKLKYNKTYTVTEEIYRFGVWVDNYYKIQEHMEEEPRSYALSIDNQFGDLSADEFRFYIHGTTDSCYKSSADLYQHPNANIVNPGMNLSPQDLPESVDWSTVTPAVVTPVKNQGQCGSCWAFR